MNNGNLYRVGPFVAVTALVAVLAGCGKSVFHQEQRAAWRSQAEAQCMRSGAVKRSSFIQPIGEVNGPGTCGMDQGLRVTGLQNGQVTLTSRQTLGCPMVATLDKWLAEVVQPAAQSTVWCPGHRDENRILCLPGAQQSGGCAAVRAQLWQWR